MKLLHKSLISIACGTMLLSGTAPVQANDDDCDLIEAFTSKDGQGLRKLSIATTRDGMFDVLIDGNKTFVSEAEYCEVDGPLSSFELNCSWDFDGFQSTALQRLEALKMQLAPCVDGKWTEPDSLYTTDDYRIVREYNAALSNANEDEIQIEIHVSEFLSHGVGSYDVRLSLER